MKHSSKLASVAFAAAAALGLVASLPTPVSGGGIGIDINIGIPAPRHHDDVVVLEYDSYCVGYRRALYDADWRLRNAQMEEWAASESLDAARAHEGEVTVRVEDDETFVADFQKRVAESDAALAAARDAAGHAADDAADARARVKAFEKRIAGAKDDIEAARTLHDGAAREDAEHRLATSEAALAQAIADQHVAEGRAADLEAAEAAAAALNDSRVRLADANAHLPALRIEMATAHDEVFAAQTRLDAALQAVALALHDRDEAMWMLHRDEILGGHAAFASCGFTIDLGVWGGHMPRDPEVMHLYFVHPVTYWVERPVEIQTRIVEVDRVVVDVGRIRQIQQKHEGPRFRAVAEFETRVPAERRREFAQRVVVERQRFAAEKTERAAAAAEHRPVRIPEGERTEARAVAVKAHPELEKARADAHAEKIEANAEVNKAKADARSEQIKANADARADKIEVKAAANAEETKARADAKAKKTEAQADRKGNAPSRTASDQKSTPKSNSKPSEPTASRTSKDSKDPRNKPKDGQASIDPNR